MDGEHTQAAELRHMRYVVDVAEHGSFKRAAAALHLAQPALSRQIRAVENQLGEALFERTRTGVRITSAGAALVEHVRQVLALADATPVAVNARAALDREIVTVGLPPGISAT